MMVDAPDILGASILIVDDQETNVSLLEQLLSETGYTRVTSTTNGPLLVSNRTLNVAGACSRSAPGLESGDCAAAGTAKRARTAASVQIHRLVINFPIEIRCVSARTFS